MWRPSGFVSSLLTAGALSSFVCCFSLAARADQPVAITKIEAGLAGTLKAGYWAPVRITLAASEAVEGELVLQAADSDGVPTRFEAADQTLRLAAGETREVVRYVKFGRFNSRTNTLRDGLVARFISGGRTITQHAARPDALPPAMPSDREWILTIGPDLGASQVLRQATVTPVDQPQVLPDHWIGYEGVTAILLTSSQPETLVVLQPRQIDALRDWVLLGGRLLLCVGARGEEVFAADSPWTALLPGTFSRTLAVRGVPSLETYTSSSQAIDAIRVDGRRVDVRMSLVSQPQGKLLAYEPSPEGVRPIVIRSAMGLGQVVFVAVDLDQPPFSLWEGRSRLIESLLRGDSSSQDRGTAREGTGQLAHLGYDDLIGQLRTALDQFRGTRLVAFSWVAGLIVLYVLLLGPADYFLLKDVVRRPHWTWLTFPILALLFCVLAVALHKRFHSSRVLVNQAEVVDIDISRGLLRGTSWLHVYSPDTRGYDVSLAPDTGETFLSWQGLPGDGLGGLQSNAPPLFTQAYDISRQNDSTTIVGAPIQTGGTKAFVARWWERDDFPTRAKLSVDADGLLRGEVDNPLSVELSECVLLYGNWAYRLERKGGVLAPRDTARVDLEQALNLNWRMTRRRVVDIKDVTTPWNQRELDVPRVMEMLMFHGAAGGEGYTRLRHRYQPYMDLSEHLRTGRAILVGQAKTAASNVTLNGRPYEDDTDQRWTFYRIVFPVSRPSPLD